MGVDCSFLYSFLTSFWLFKYIDSFAIYKQPGKDPYYVLLLAILTSNMVVRRAVSSVLLTKLLFAYFIFSSYYAFIDFLEPPFLLALTTDILNTIM